MTLANTLCPPSLFFLKITLTSVTVSTVLRTNNVHAYNEFLLSFSQQRLGQFKAAYNHNSMK